jgi:hypothetical protein
MAGLVPAIYGYSFGKVVDARDKPGHEGLVGHINPTLEIYGIIHHL